jgi:hypothetical protein
MEFIFDEEDIQAKIDDRGDDLFHPEEGKPELEVNDLFFDGDGIGVAKDQCVRDINDLTCLQQVRHHPRHKKAEIAGACMTNDIVSE